MTRVKLILFGLLLLTILGLGHEVALGAVAQWGSHNYDALLVLPPTYPPRQKLATFIMDKQDSVPFQVGRVVGSTATILQGITEIVDGGRRIQVGVLVSAENVGIGGAVAVSGVAEGVHGAVVVSQGVRGWVESGGQILKMAGKGGGTLPITNKNGMPYPQIKNLRTGQFIPEPPRNLAKVPTGQRVSWNGQDRYNFIKEWHDRGYSTPEGGWEQYDIHHIIPREYGGTNVFDNLVPVLREIHQQELNTWWRGY